MVNQTKQAPKHLLLLLTVSALSVAYVPLEVIPAAWGTAEAVFAAVLVLGLRYRVFTTKFSMIEVAGTALIFWLIARMTLLSLAEGAGINIASMRDAMAIFAGLILFRIAKHPELRNVILRGATVGLVLGLGLEAYQLLIGLPRLRALGYIPPMFNYDTATGAYRPFGGFFTPVTFGASLAMSIALLTFSGRSRKVTPVFVIGVGGLVLTYTRGAWVGLLAAVLVGIMMTSQKVRARMALAALPLVYCALFAVLLFPNAFSEPLSRFLTIGDSEYGSNLIRIELWEGVLHVVGERPLVGYGTAPFVEVLRPVIGNFAEFGHAHNTFLMVMFQYGFIGLLLLAALTVTMFISVIKLVPHQHSFRPASVAVLVVFMASSVTETTWGSFHLLTFLFVAVGLAFAPTGGDSEHILTRSRPSANGVR